MKISSGLKENGIVVGNAYDKYSSRNPLVRRIMYGFDESLATLVRKTAPETIHEIGCGEGYLTLNWHKQGFVARGSDFSSKVIALARANALEQGFPSELFEIRSIYDLETLRDSADLVVCCEVLEHLEYPEKGLQAIQRVATNYVILSVPREPIWRILNMIRGKYLYNFGNTSGHLQHWSYTDFTRMVGHYFEIVEILTPLPWTMLLCNVKR